MILGSGVESLSYWNPPMVCQQGRVENATRSLCILRGQSKDLTYIQEELAEIIANFECESELIPASGYFDSWAACFSGGKVDFNILVPTPVVLFWECLYS